MRATRFTSSRRRDRSLAALVAGLALDACQSGEATTPPVAAALVSATAPTGPVELQRVSLGEDGVETLTCRTSPRACKNNSHPAISADGMAVVFDSDAANVIPALPNPRNVAQVYWRNIATGEVRMVSAGSIDGASAPGNAGSDFADISGDGRFVAFQSSADNLVAGDTNKSSDVFIASLQLNELVRITQNSGGAQFDSNSGEPVLSYDGRLVAFSSNAKNMQPLWAPGGKKPAGRIPTGLGEVLLIDVQSGQIEWISLCDAPATPNGTSSQPSIDENGTRIVFTSGATNLVGADANGAVDDVFVCDRTTGKIECVSCSWDGAPGAKRVSHKAAISGSGRYVSFESPASDLLPPGQDTNDKVDIFVRDLVAKQTVRVNVSTTGEQAADNSGYSALSSDGRFVVFTSLARNLVTNPIAQGYQFFVRDRDVSGNGRFDEPRDVSTRRLSQTPDGTAARGKNGGNTDISVDGRFAVFMSEASNLIPFDQNGVETTLGCTPSCPFGRDVFRARIF